MTAYFMESVLEVAGAAKSRTSSKGILRRDRGPRFAMGRVGANELLLPDNRVVKVAKWNGQSLDLPESDDRVRDDRNAGAARQVIKEEVLREQVALDVRDLVERSDHLASLALAVEDRGLALRERLVAEDALQFAEHDVVVGFEPAAEFGDLKESARLDDR